MNKVLTKFLLAVLVLSGLSQSAFARKNHASPRQRNLAPVVAASSASASDGKLVQDIGGQFIWTNQGGLVHWLHADTQHRRPDGYVIVDGQTYGLH